MTASSRERGLVEEALPAYEVGDELGRGAFGVVYAAQHRQLGREVAVKQLPRAFAADPSVRERFVAEAQMVARLDHPHIVPVYDFVDREDGMCLIIMERCAGAISDRFTGDGLATDEACAAVLACCAALDFAHSAGVLHRDIKPENLLLDTKGVVKLGDFGIARALDASARRTATGMVIGTPAYMSPEQVRGEDLTPASDVYSVGIMAYELLSGGFPFEGANSATGLLAHHLVTPPTPLTTARAELPATIGAVIDQSLAKDTADRQASALEFGTELTRACVTSFGTGWLRRRRFVLHWPEIIAESERPDEAGARTGTIMVKADSSRTLLAGARGIDDDPPDTADHTAPPGEPVATPTIAPTGQPTPSPAPVPPSAVPPSAVSASSDTSPAAQPAAPTAASTAPTPPPPSPAPAPEPAAANPPSDSNRGPNRGVLVAGACAVVLIVAVLAFALTRGGGSGDVETAEADPTSASDNPIDENASADGSTDVEDTGSQDDGDQTSGASDATAAATGEVTADQADTADADVGQDTDAVPDSAESADAATLAGSPLRDELIVDSPWTPSPCPTEPERVVCIIAGVSLDDATGEMVVGYEAFGYVPELEPADRHIHFYLDTVVAGDERKAGTEVPGGGWRIWDGLGPFTSFGGENGRTGFTAADVQSANARFLCVLVAEVDHTAVPGTGNCAPIPQVFDVDAAVEQVDRQTGIYAGRCAIGATLILPAEWRWLDLVATSPAEAARILRPLDVATAEPLVSELVASGGVLWADGPVDDDFIVNLSVIRIEGNYTSLDSPATVREELARSGLTPEGEQTEITFFGRTVNKQVVDEGDTQLTQYVIPDFGYALLLSFTARDAAKWQESFDAIAATTLGC